MKAFVGSTGILCCRLARGSEQGRAQADRPPRPVLVIGAYMAVSDAALHPAAHPCTKALKREWRSYLDVCKAWILSDDFLDR